MDNNNENDEPKKFTTKPRPSFQEGSSESSQIENRNSRCRSTTAATATLNNANKKMVTSWPNTSSTDKSSTSSLLMTRSDVAKEKFPSPSRERLSPTESKRRIEEKQSKAEE